MTDEAKSKRKQTFPIRNFSKLLDEFLATHTLKDGGIVDLQSAVNEALLAHYKK